MNISFTYTNEFRSEMIPKQLPKKIQTRFTKIGQSNVITHLYFIRMYGRREKTEWSSDFTMMISHSRVHTTAPFVFFFFLVGWNSSLICAIWFDTIKRFLFWLFFTQVFYFILFWIHLVCIVKCNQCHYNYMQRRLHPDFSFDSSNQSIHPEQNNSTIHFLPTEITSLMIRLFSVYFSAQQCLLFLFYLNWACIFGRLFSSTYNFRLFYNFVKYFHVLALKSLCRLHVHSIILTQNKTEPLQLNFSFLWFFFYLFKWF